MRIDPRVDLPRSDFPSGVLLQVVGAAGGQAVLLRAGRFDGLLSSVGLGERPAAGVSIYVTRLLAAAEAAAAQAAAEASTASSSSSSQASLSSFRPASAVDVLVCSVGPGLAFERLRAVSELWAAGVRADLTHGDEPDLHTQMAQADLLGVPTVAILKRAKRQPGAVNASAHVAGHSSGVPLAASIVDGGSSDGGGGAWGGGSGAGMGGEGCGGGAGGGSEGGGASTTAGSGGIGGGSGGADDGSGAPSMRVTLRHLRGARREEEVALAELPRYFTSRATGHQGAGGAGTGGKATKRTAGNAKSSRGQTGNRPGASPGASPRNGPSAADPMLILPVSLH